MKKNIVFVIPSLSAGGGEKSLVNLLNVIDYNKYEVDLVLFHQSGIFLELLPQEVNIIAIEGDYPIFTHSLGKSILLFLQQFKWKLALNRMLFAFKNRVIKNKGFAEQISWKNLNASIPYLEKKYDVAIGFLEKSSIYLVVDKIKAEKKIGFIHNDYKKLGLVRKFDLPFFTQLDSLVTVSEECAKVLTAIFPEIRKKISVIYNIVSEKLIRELADSESVIEMQEGGLSLLSIGRLHPQKGFDLAIEACKIVIDRGFDIKWYVIGEGNERPELEAHIEKNGLSQHFFLIGLRENPYPYLKKGLVYVQTSRYEGKSIAIDEAKIMHKPIVVTNFTTVKDQIQDGQNGVVTEMNPESVAAGIIKMITDKNLQEKIISNLKLENLSTENEIEKLYQLIN